MKKLLKGGVIVGASGCRKADLLIDGERIEAVGEALSCPEAEEIDVSCKLLFPGFLDAHPHRRSAAPSPCSAPGTGGGR